MFRIMESEERSEYIRNIEFVDVKCEIENINSVKEEPLSDDDDSSIFSYSKDVKPNRKCKEEPTQTLSFDRNFKDVMYEIEVTPITSLVKLKIALKCQLCKQKITEPAGQFGIQESIVTNWKLNDPILCRYCASIGVSNASKTDGSPDTYNCDVCSKNFVSKASIIRHIQLHEGRTFACKICNKRFSCLAAIKPHMRVHTGEKPFPCSICNRNFSHKSNMLRHQANHSKVKLLKCNICNKKFPRESRLVYHMRVHTNNKPFKCGVCNRLFSHRQNILRHYTRKHPNDKYDALETDASVARDIWENVIKKNVDMLPN